MSSAILSMAPALKAAKVVRNEEKTRPLQDQLHKRQASNLSATVADVSNITKHHTSVAY